MAGRGPQSFQKRQKEQQRKEKQEEKRARRFQRKQQAEAGGDESAVLNDGEPGLEDDTSSLVSPSGNTE
jgi:hypothetical protein